MTSSHQLGLLSLDLVKYPRTPHIESSRRQVGDVGDHVPYRHLHGRHIVVEEKLDAANSGISFDAAGELLLQSRGHYLTGGGRERQFNLFKHWSATHEGALLRVLEDRYIAYGEWMHKLHSCFYDALPHLWCEFDVWDRSRECFLGTEARDDLFRGAPVLGVPVLYAGIAPRRLEDLLALLGPSQARTSEWRSAFERTVRREGHDVERAWRLLNRSDLAEGLYIKVEEDGRTVERFKWVRPDFVQSILDGGTHHAEQPFIPNLLAPGADIHGPRLTHVWADGRRRPS
jgi:hypothetical protein